MTEINRNGNTQLKSYYLGVIIDYKNTTAERKGSNDTAHLAIQVVD